MKNPVKLVAENPDLVVKPLDEIEMKDLIEVLDLLSYHSDALKQAQLGPTPEYHCEGYEMARDDLSSLLMRAEELKRRIQQINMPCIAADIQKCLTERFSELDGAEMRRALRTVLNKYYK